MTSVVRAELGMAGVLAALAVTLRQAGPAAPSAFWPTSVVGWLTAFVSFGGAVALIYGYHRFSQKPALDAVASARQDMMREVARCKEESAAHLNHFRHSVTADLNGFGGRVKILEDDAARATGVLEALREAMVESKAVDRHTAEMMRRIIDEMAAHRKEQREREDRIMDAIDKIRRGQS